uniref:Protein DETOXIFICATION n=1 Tax=Aegilops tauschii subsp. strangulata TaxID=200361 RepID=A0A453IYZ8_AEGTS
IVQSSVRSAMAGSRRGGDEEACRVGLLDGHGGAKKDDWQVVDGGEGSSKLGRRVLEESKKLWVIVAPAMFSRIVTFSMNVITQAFAGHLGDLELAAISIANTVVVGFSFGLMVRTHEPPARSCLRSNSFASLLLCLSFSIYLW